MKKSDDRVKHALHNADVCEYLKLKDGFHDWVITTAFYSALHFVSYKIFPIEAVGIGNKKTSLDTLDQYFNYMYGGKNKSKHDVLCGLVDQKCENVSIDYLWLKDMSMLARYNNYHYSPQVADKAVRLMKSIRDACVPKEELKAA